MSYATAGEEAKSNPWQTVRQVLVKLIKNPLVSMSFLGLVVNVATNHTLPEALDNFLITLGNAFASISLFLLGQSMVGKMGNMKTENLFLPLLLTLLKVIQPATRPTSNH